MAGWKPAPVRLAKIMPYGRAPTAYIGNEKYSYICCLEKSPK